MNKKKNQIIKIIAVATAVVLTLSTALVFGGCGDKKADTGATVAPTTAATAAVNSKSADGAQDQGNDAQQSGDQSSSQGGDSASSHSINEVWYADISEQAAGQAALQQVGSNARVTFYEAGTYNGQECWIVYVTDDSTGASYTCYVSGSFVQVEEGNEGHSINDTYYAGISEQMAGQQAIAAFGGDDTSAVRITGYAAEHYNGSEAWCVHLINDNTGEEGTVYVSGDFCVVA